MCNREQINVGKFLCVVFCLLHLWVPGEDSRGASDARGPNAPDLVRAVRKSENWIHKVDSFYLRMDSKWTTPPHPNLPESLKRGRPFKSGTTDTMEFAFDNKRVRQMQDMHGGSYSLRIWNGSQLIVHTKLDPRDRGCCYSYSKLQSRSFLQLIASSGSWPRAQPHSFWFDKKNVEEILPEFGMPEDFVLAGRSEYRGVDCYVLACDLSGISEWTVGRVYRWYVGVKDHFLYGKVHLRHGKVDTEHWALVYKEVAKDRWLPMTQGYEIFGLDGEYEPYLYTRRDLKVVEVRVNEELADELFEVQLEEGVEVVDKRTEETIRYIQKESLVGKTLPDSNEIDIDFTAEEMRGKSHLICFFDIEQRPSRHMVRELAKLADSLNEKGGVVICVQAAKVERGKLDEWVKENKVPFAVGMIEGDEEKVRFEWGVKSLPWLIFTDEKGIVRAEGFGFDELDDTIGKLEDDGS